MLDYLALEKSYYEQANTVKAMTTNYSTINAAQAAGFVPTGEDASKRPATAGQSPLRQFTDWQQILLAAKAAYQSGLHEQALLLYRKGLRCADSKLDGRGELTIFLQKHLWS